MTDPKDTKQELLPADTLNEPLNDQGEPIEQTEQTPNETTDSAPAKGNRSQKIAFALASIALVLVIGLVIAGGWMWTQYQALLDRQQQNAAASSNGMGKIKQELAQLNQRLNTEVIAQVEDLNQQQSSINADQQRLRESVNTVRALAAPEQKGWALSEAEYLMRVANHRLTFLRDPNTALEALESADLRLLKLDDPAVADIRATLAQEILSLKTLERPDIQGMALKINSLAKLIEALPLPGPESQSIRLGVEQENSVANEADDSVLSSDTQRSLEQAADKVWNSVKSLVTVRRKGESGQAVLSPRESYFLRENLKLKLEAARLDLLQRNADAYQADLNKAEQWVAKYFIQDTPEVRHTLIQIRDLASVDIREQSPDISGSLRAITLLRARLAGEAEGRALRAGTQDETQDGVQATNQVDKAVGKAGVAPAGDAQ